MGAQTIATSRGETGWRESEVDCGDGREDARAGRREVETRVSGETLRGRGGARLAGSSARSTLLDASRGVGVHASRGVAGSAAAVGVEEGAGGTGGAGRGREGASGTRGVACTALLDASLHILVDCTRHIACSAGPRWLSEVLAGVARLAVGGRPRAGETVRVTRSTHRHSARDVRVVSSAL